MLTWPTATNYRWSSRQTVWAIAAGASLSAAAVAYRLYRYHGWFSRAGIRPIADGELGSHEIKRAIDEYLQFHYGTEQEILPYPHAPKVLTQAVMNTHNISLHLCDGV